MASCGICSDSVDGAIATLRDTLDGPMVLVWLAIVGRQAAQGDNSNNTYNTIKQQQELKKSERKSERREKAREERKREKREIESERIKEKRARGGDNATTTVHVHEVEVQ
jgi:hypothetical protein